MPKDPPRALVFQHLRSEHPGVFRDFMAEDGIEWQPVHWDEDEVSPDLADFDMLIVMGGPQDVWEEDKYPWLRTEKDVIEEAVIEREMPFLGFCLGHQLLADVLGGEVAKAKIPEVGVMDVELTKAGQRSAFYLDMPKVSKFFEWHGAEVTRAPDIADVLALSSDCAVQALSYRERAFGMQFHVEITPTTVHDWVEMPSYKDALDKALGDGGIDILKSETDALMPTFNREARQLYANFIRATR